MSEIQSRNDWVFGSIKNPLEDKEYMVRQNVINMLNKSTRMFKYNNLPETIPYKDMETYLQVGGFSILYTHNDNLYAFSGGLGGKPNPYYLPTIATVANPALGISKNLEIDKECVVILNDHYYQGLMPMFNKYARMLAEAEMSLKIAIINARVPALVEADNDATYSSAKSFFEKIVKGEEYGVIASKEFFDGVRTHDFYKIDYIKNLIEAIQYIKGSWYNELGINAAFNMKREAINEAEAALNEDVLYPTIDTMLECRQLGLEKVNKMFGTDITVELDSVWKQNRITDKLSLEIMKEEAGKTNETD